MEDYCRIMLEDFLNYSFSSVEALVKKIEVAKGQNPNRQFTLFRYSNGEKISVPFRGDHFFLRGSVEYSNPQITLEEIQGIVATRLLEACSNHFGKAGLRQPDRDDVEEIYEALHKPTDGYIVPFLLNTDDVEADRYSNNPLRGSIVESGQSAYPVATVKTDQLKIDKAYTQKYMGKLISQKEIDLIEGALKESKGSYIEMVDSIKYQQLQQLTKFCGMDLSLYTLRMPLATLEAETKEGLLHQVISQSNRDYASVEEAYTCMGRSMSKRTTLLTVPHSTKGYGSKRAARGKLHFENGELESVTVKYQTTALYPNGVDNKDISMAVCDDNFTVEGKKLSDYSYAQTPSSPQFSLYMMGSPEDAVIWHGIGTYGSMQLLQSYSAARAACKNGGLIRGLHEKYGVNLEIPLQFNLAPAQMWSHPKHNNIDASVGSVEDISVMAQRGMRLEYLSDF
ncbi:MAG: hypothetical protein NWE93_05800 [Candidatus Bathyarchaeota archaeon]|nr:hypothetical protein [Candidatus Bathyarchaeota archaeon]